MKKFVIFIMVCGFFVLMTSCDTATGSGNTYTVSFASDVPDVTYQEQVINEGDTVGLPLPVKEGYSFLGWFVGQTINDSQFTSNDSVHSNLILYARWEENLEDDNIPLGIECIPSTDLIGAVYDETYNSIDVVYKILTVKNGIIEQLSPWVSSGASEIEITTEKITTNTITAGISLSISATVGVDAKVFKAETTFGVTASLEAARSVAVGNSLSLRYSLDDYPEGLNYAVFLTGSYEVYQVFSTSLETKEVFEYYLVKVIEDPVARLISSSGTDADIDIDLSEYKMTSFNSRDYFAGGDGTVDSPYQIDNEDGLFAMLLNPSSHFKLVDNIVLEDFKGGYDIVFTGVFDGNGYSINGLDITIEIPSGGFAEETNFGFFAVNNGVIKNLTFRDGFIMLKYFDGAHAGDGYVNAGIVSGKTLENSVITNVKVENSIVETWRFNSNTGGMVGLMLGGKISGSEVISTTVSSCGNIGGIVGAISNIVLDKYNEAETYIGERNYIGIIENTSFTGTDLNQGIINFYSTVERRASGGISGATTNSHIVNAYVDNIIFIINGDRSLYPSQAIISGYINSSKIISPIWDNIDKVDYVGVWDTFWIPNYGIYYFPSAHQSFGWDPAAVDYTCEAYDHVLKIVDVDGIELYRDYFNEGDILPDINAIVLPSLAGYNIVLSEFTLTEMPGNDVEIVATYILD